MKIEELKKSLLKFDTSDKKINFEVCEDLNHITIKFLNHFIVYSQDKQILEVQNDKEVLDCILKKIALYKSVLNVLEYDINKEINDAKEIKKDGN
jgi:hypothetical protein